MEQPKCSIFESCDAPLCPLDPDLKKRVWFADEPICRSSKYGGHRWIRKQRSIVRHHTARWFKKPITQQQLFDASRPMKLTDDQRAVLSLRLKKMLEGRQKKAA